MEEQKQNSNACNSCGKPKQSQHFKAIYCDECRERIAKESIQKAQQKYYYAHHEKMLARAKAKGGSNPICPQCKGVREFRKKLCETCRVKNRQEHNLRKRENQNEADKKYYQKKRLEVLSKIGRGKIECVYCKCDDLRILEINHINGGGCKETFFGPDGTFGRIKMARNILKGTRGIDDLEITCRVCNANYYVKQAYQINNFEIKWNKNN